MKRFWLYLSTLLALVAGTGCAEDLIEMEPVVHLIITGSFVDENHLPVQGLEVWALGSDMTIPSESAIAIGEPVVTDAEGAYRIEGTTRPFTFLHIMVRGRDNEGNLIETGALASVSFLTHELERKGNQWDFGTIERQLPAFVWNPSKQ